MSVDTYLQGKNLKPYKAIHDDEDMKVLVAPKLLNYARRIELVTRKKLVGAKLIAIAHHKSSDACSR
ncbi:MAG: hypothetical protein AAF467_04045 [Actinomycetota bacterium]